jgi:hypothetical protein
VRGGVREPLEAKCDSFQVFLALTPVLIRFQVIEVAIPAVLLGLVVYGGASRCQISGVVLWEAPEGCTGWEGIGRPLHGVQELWLHFQELKHREGHFVDLDLSIGCCKIEEGANHRVREGLVFLLFLCKWHLTFRDPRCQTTD